MRLVVAAVLLAAVVQAQIGFFRYPLEHPGAEDREMTGEKPLILTGMDPVAARAAAEVKGAGIDALVKSYSGFFTTQNSTNNQMFFWYIEPTNPVGKAEDAELLVWLQGGPGGSSMFGALSEMSALDIARNGSRYEAVKRPISWNDRYAMIFIDNPVGAGFSFTESDAGFCNNTRECVSRNLYSLMQQFYTVFPEKLNAPLYVTGESYGGHYVPGMAHYIHEQNLQVEAGRSKALHLPLKGVAIGDGWIDPVNMMGAYPDMMFAQGLISSEQREQVRAITTKATRLIKEEKMLEAFNVWDAFLNGDVFPYPNLFHNMTGLNDYDNYMNTNAPVQMNYYGGFLNQADVRKALHVGDSPFPFDPSSCEHHLLSDFMVSFRGELEVLANNYRVLVYSGQLDVIIGSALTESFLPFMQWRGQKEFNAAPRDVWRINDNDAEVAGYVRQADNGQFTYTIIRGAGHIAPFDQPARARDMIERFVQNLPYKNLPNPSK